MERIIWEVTVAQSNCPTDPWGKCLVVAADHEIAVKAALEHLQTDASGRLQVALHKVYR